MTSLTYDYQDCYLWPSPMIYDLWLWSMTYDYHLSPITVTHDYPWPWLITCHSWLIQNHDWSHMIIAHDYQGLSLMTIIHDYEQYLWTSPMTIRPYDLWFITCEYHTRLLPMTIIHDYAHHTWLCPSHDLPQLTMTATHDYDCHPWLWLSPMTMNITHNLPPLMTSLHHSWLSSLYVTYDCHRSLITRDDYLSPMTLITQNHHPWPWLSFITHDYDFLLTTSTHALSLMSYHPCLVSHVYLWPSWLMTYDLQLITRDYHIRPSFMTIIHDHQVWSLDFSPMTSHPWLLRSSQQWPWLTIGDFPSHDHHPWACHPP